VDEPRTEGRGSLTDRVIDAVAKAMTDVEPHADLRARVMARIDEPRRRRVAWTWIVGPVAAAALVVLAIVLPPLMRTRSSPPTPVRTMPIERTVASPTRDVPTPIGAIAPVPPVAPARHARARTAAVRDSGIVVEPPHGGVVVEALQAHEPISIAPVQRPAVRVADVTVAPLAELAPLEVEPLPASRGRD